MEGLPAAGGAGSQEILKPSSGLGDLSGLVAKDGLGQGMAEMSWCFQRAVPG